MHEKEIHPDRLETRTALLEQSIGHINQTLIRIEKKLEKHDDEFKDLKKEMRSDFKWTISMMISLTVFTISGFTGLWGVIAHGFKWI